MKNPQTDFGVAGNPRHVKRDKKTGRFVSKRRRRRKNSLGTSALSYMKEGGANPFRLSTKDVAVIDAFINRASGASKKLTTNGVRLDGNWMGGRGIAEWEERLLHGTRFEQLIEFRDLGSKAAQTVQRKIRKLAPGGWIRSNPRPRRKNSTVRVAKPKTMSRTQLALGRNNPEEIDRVMAVDLYSYIENDRDLYRQKREPILKNMTRKKASGKYDSEASIKGWMYLVDDGTKKYMREFGYTEASGPWHKVFPKPLREHVAGMFRDSFEAEYELGNFDEWIPKKYRKGNPLNKTNVRWKGKHRGPRKVRKVSPQWWKITKYRKNGRVMGHHIGQGTVRQAKLEAAKLSEARGVNKVVLRGPYKNKPMKGKR